LSPIVVKHRCGEVLLVSHDLIGDWLEKVYRKYGDKCPGCHGRLSWTPLKVDVKPLKTRKRVVLDRWLPKADSNPTPRTVKHIYLSVATPSNVIAKTAKH
jgi:hypothetical protein